MCLYQMVKDGFVEVIFKIEVIIGKFEGVEVCVGLKCKGCQVFVDFVQEKFSWLDKNYICVD